MTTGNAAADICAIYVDTGTTNTRGWLQRGDRILARRHKPVGVRNTARDGQPSQLRTALKELIAELDSTAAANGDGPSWVIGAGMLSSSLGLAELPHIPAPCGTLELAQAARVCRFPEITALPLLLVPGVICGVPPDGPDFPRHFDVMRGEETLCLGLVQQQLLKTPGVVVTLGSHWKAIRVDGEGRIISSTTTLSGELIHALQTRTILAASVPLNYPDQLDLKWVEAGAATPQPSGLSRTLFKVRLLDLSGQGSPVQRLSFLIGAFIGSDLEPLLNNRDLTGHEGLVISGNVAIAEGWRHVLSSRSIAATVLTSAETDSAFLTGLQEILLRFLCAY
ncbi:MAG TPA: 2-dehydro-3-deoxygalactonokinase [Pyrinomonadaceae bacterium]|nr:2-dehydro-3-deoxygalactonokinase [Pyrinomonadaceae bacterium]